MTLQPFAEWLLHAGLYGDASPLVTPTMGRKGLAELFKLLGFKRGAEIGVLKGEYSEIICRANPGVELLCVDPWMAYADYDEPRKDQTRLNDAYREAGNRLRHFHCQLWRLTSLEAAKQVPDGSLDFIYIDANHQEPFISQDLEAWSRKVRPGGIVAGHDYFVTSDKPWVLDVKPAVEKFTAEHGIDPWYVLASEKAPSYFWVQP